MEGRMEEIDEELSRYKVITDKLKKEKNEIQAEIDRLNRMEVTKRVEEFDGKLKALLSEDEYKIVINGMDKRDYKDGTNGKKDVEKLYNRIKQSKDKFTEHTLILRYVSKCGQLDSYPPESFYDVHFQILNVPDIYIGSMGSLCIETKTLQRAMVKMNRREEEFQFLSKKEREVLAMAFYGKVDAILEHLPQIQRAKSIITNGEFSGFENNCVFLE